MSQKLENQFWKITVDPYHGAITHLSHPDDPHGMNWVCSSEESLWFPNSSSWGLGYVSMPDMGGGSPRWQIPASPGRYRIGALEIKVNRKLRGKKFEEEYVFTNTGPKDQPLYGIALFTPFNDNYPDSKTCTTKRCNAHIWCGGNITYVCALRMGGAAPHLGMVLTDGFIGGYSIEGRGLVTCGSNTRGAIILNGKGATLAPGQSYRIAWTMFWHTGWEDFFRQACALPGFVDVRAEHYTLIGKEQPKITVNDKPVVPKRTDGEKILIPLPDGRETWLAVQHVEDVGELIQQRARFIAKKQLVRDKKDRFHGALLSYDNDTRATLHNPKWPDQGEGREHLGMGILLSKAAKRSRDKGLAAAARSNHEFISTRLQTPDGTVFDSINDRKTQRLYNYPWFAHFHLEIGDLEACFRTFRQYYKRGGAKFYAFPIQMLDTVKAFQAAGRKKQAKTLLGWFRGHADLIVATGTDIPPHEVNYEQTIIGPAALIPLEVYLLTGDEKYLQCVEAFMPLLDAFNGRQPDHHLNDIAIRHWDGYWFGSKQMWGDTFPHYWSALTGWVFYRYWQATGDETYRRRGREILLNNLSAFHPDGAAHCAYIYPDLINGNPGRRWDPLANDQDWALVFVLQAAEIDPAFETERWH